MIIKAVGALLLSLCSTMIGYSKAYSLLSRITFLDDFIKFIVYVQIQTHYAQEPVSHIIKTYKGHKSFNIFLQNVSKSFSSNTPLLSAWTRAVRSIPKSIGLTTDDVSLVEKFANGLGISDIDGQRSHCELQLEAFRTKLLEARENYTVRSKIYIALGLFSGISISLILV